MCAVYTLEKPEKPELHRDFLSVETTTSVQTALDEKEKQREYQRRWREKNKERLKAATAANYQKHKAERDAYRKKYAVENKEKLTEYHRRYSLQRISQRAAYAKKYNAEHRDEISKKRKETYSKNPLPAVARAKKRYLLKKEEVKLRIKEYKSKNAKRYRDSARERYSTDLQYKLGQTLRVRLAMAVRAQLNGTRKKGGSAVSDLGCTLPEFITYIERKFVEGQTWGNWGRGKEMWNIDHIIPISSFDLTNPEQCKAACHYTNMQPLWTTDNVAKGNRR